ncbi:MAG: major capsid protein [Salinarimonadaceae bacterium]|nr:MAG: major capsid protein [Salinarimonadaceae bacterium]
MLDIFNDDAFSVTSLTDALRDTFYKPGRIAELGLFSRNAVSTTTISIERVGEILKLVSPSPRGGPGETRDYPKRSLRPLSIPHFERDFAVMADEVQGVRAFGSTTALQTVQGIFMQKMQPNLVDFDLTEEHARLGAITGVITYADSSSLNLFTEFGVTQETEVDFDLDAASPVDGILRKRCTQVIRTMRKRLGATPFDSVHAFVGDNFFDDLLQHKEVRETYKGWNEAQILRESYVGKNRSSNPMFEFGGIVWENYGAIGDQNMVNIGVNTDKARFFPLGVDGLFKTYDAPADYIETVNTPGQRLYAKQFPMQNGKGIHGEVQMNSLSICLRPGSLFGARRT